MNSGIPPGITLSPAIEQLTLSPDQSDYSFTAYAANHTNQTLNLTLAPVDFSPLNDTGGIAFNGSSASNLSTTHGLAQWISLVPDKLTLLPGASQPFQVNLTGTDSLSPGGHYAAIVLHLANNAGPVSSNRVQLNQDVSMLLFTATNGAGTRDISLSQPATGIAWFHLPQVINLFLSDSGNTQITPRGYITLYNSSQQPLSRSLVNSGSALVLPGSTRLLETPTNATQKPFWPGVYHVQIAYTYDGAAKMNYYNANFIYVGAPLVIAVAVVLFTLIAAQFARRRWSRKYRVRH